MCRRRFTRQVSHRSLSIVWIHKKTVLPERETLSYFHFKNVTQFIRIISPKTYIDVPSLCPRMHAWMYAVHSRSKLEATISEIPNISQFGASPRYCMVYIQTTVVTYFITCISNKTIIRTYERMYYLFILSDLALKKKHTFASQVWNRILFFWLLCFSRAHPTPRPLHLFCFHLIKWPAMGFPTQLDIVHRWCQGVFRPQLVPCMHPQATFVQLLTLH